MASVQSHLPPQQSRSSHMQERDAVETLKLELDRLINKMEDDHRRIQRLVAELSRALVLHGNFLNSYLHQEKEAENRRYMSTMNEALSPFCVPSDQERESLQQIANLQEQLATLIIDFEHLQANSSLNESYFGGE